MSTKKMQPPAGQKFLIDSEVTRCIRQHARAFMTTEVCGVLIGEEANGTVSIQASIEASNATQGGTHVTFTQDAWEEIYRIKDVSYPDQRIVGWYHSHPGFGVFLSEHDTFIHSNFFSSPHQVAWVYDPHTDEEGCFGWFDGKIQRIPSLEIVDLSGDGEERTPIMATGRTSPETVHASSESRPRTLPPPSRRPVPKWTDRLLSGVSYLMVAVLAFFISFFLFPSVVGIAVDPTTMRAITIEGRPVMVGHIQLEQMLKPATLPPNPTAPPAANPPAAPPRQQPAPHPNPSPKASQ
jgi:proteasome lid subunit RPN8/RPN11